MLANAQVAPQDPFVPAEITPKDSITKLEFNPVADFLAVGSWDSTVKIYQVDPSSGQSADRGTIQHDGPVLGVAWSKDGTKLLSASADKSCKLYDLNATQSPAVQIAAHDGPISCVRWIDMPNGSGGQGICVTASWDKTVKYWDMRTPNPIATIQASERVYAMDACEGILVYGTADRQVSIVDLKQNPAQPKSTKESTLKMQTRVITCFPAGNGYAIGSVEGRVAIQYVEEKDAPLNFSFKCHRVEPLASARPAGETSVWAVNAISFNHKHGTFSTAGGDGTLSFWDKDQRTRLKTYSNKELHNSETTNKQHPPTPIVSTSFSKDSNLFAYAFSYDWSRGQSGAVPTNRTQIMIHGVLPEEIKPKNKGVGK